MQNLISSPGCIKHGELYRVTGISHGISYTCIARAQKCIVCDIGYDFISLNSNTYLIGDAVTCVTFPLDGNDIEFYEGSHPST